MLVTLMKDWDVMEHFTVAFYTIDGRIFGRLATL
jgi:hypothetical protein